MNMSNTINETRPPVIHHEHSPWPQRYATLIGVVALHVGVGAALLAMQLSAPSTIEPPVLTVQWVPTTKTALPQPKPEQKPKEPPPKKPVPEVVQKPVPVPQVKPVEMPLIQAPAAAPVVAETPKAPSAPPTPPQPAPAPQQVAQVAPPVDPNLNPEVDCTRSPEPVYPAASMKLGEEGTVMLRMQVDERGRPLRVEIESSSKYGRLDRAAREAVATEWVCPLRRGKQGFSGWLRVPVKFVLPSL